ncbi:UNVERIFIED_CONTAM: Zinc finger BED domain-containing protein RICESLEEPER 3 [Sesamum calycinum]|uniref:Zinc finger BED domain-containing protein RICESLEEPER 3 n=1 Tax=Sesamum calycinum TaxID=2727403 RepID=A0AAW2SXA6_9LAMI
MRFLEPFHEMTELFSGHRYPTSNLYFRNVWRIQMLLQEQMVSTDLAISRMAKDMKSKFDKYWNCYSIVLTFAVVLDPRYKLEFVEFCYKKLDVSTSYDKVNVLREQMRELFEEYLRVIPPLCEQSSTIGTISGCDDDMDIMIDEFDSYRSQCADARSQSQLDLYLGETLIDRKQFSDLNVLYYWRRNSVRYPKLALMARDVLSIPITTVASESAFSHGGRIIGKFRSSILPTNAEAILCGRDWLEAYDYEDDEDEDANCLSTNIENLVGPFRYLGGVLRAQGLPWRGLIFRPGSSGTIYGNHEKRLLIRDGKNLKRRLVQQSRRGYAKEGKLNGIVN